MLSLLKKLIVNWCLSVKVVTALELYDSSSPTVVSIPDQSGKLKFIGQGTSTRLVSTPSGWSPIRRVLKTVEYEVWRLTLENGMFLEGADEHLVITEAGEKHLCKLTLEDVVLTSSGPSKVLAIEQLADRSENMYDLELDDDDHVYYTNGILSHNTTVVAMYILWMTCFQDDKLCVIASKAMNHAVEIMSRIKFAYEELPEWLKPGCRYYSRTTIEFENGSKVKSEATSEKTGRGGSPSLLFIDEIAFLGKNIQEEMWASLAPSLGTGGKFVVTSTPNGDSDLFATIWRGANAGTNGFAPFKALWYQHPDRDQEWYNKMAAKLGPVKAAQELDCHFLSSDSLLIDSRKLHGLRTKKPIHEDMGFKFWKEVDSTKSYLVGVDPATGNGSDFTVIQVFEFPTLEQVAELRLNEVHIPLIYSKIKWLLRKLTAVDPRTRRRADVLWSFERNGVGEALVAMIQNDDSTDGGVYLDNVELFCDSAGKLGCYTTGKSKLVSCMKLKNLVEKIQNSMVINSDVLLEELKNFIARGGSYAAKNGSTDDAVSATLVVVRLLERLASYDDVARNMIFESVRPDMDPTMNFEDQHADEPYGVF